MYAPPDRRQQRRGTSRLRIYLIAGGVLIAAVVLLIVIAIASVPSEDELIEDLETDALLELIEASKDCDQLALVWWESANTLQLQYAEAANTRGLELGCPLFQPFKLPTVTF